MKTLTAITAISMALAPFLAVSAFAQGAERAEPPKPAVTKYTKEEKAAARAERKAKVGKPVIKNESENGAAAGTGPSTAARLPPSQRKPDVAKDAKQGEGANPGEKGPKS